jgi:hypothetical protein
LKLKTWLTITAVIAATNGLSYLLAPAMTMSYFGFETNDAGLLLARYFGASTFGVAILAWLARRIVALEARRLVVTVLLYTFFLYAAVDLIGVLSGVMNAPGWLFVATDLVLATGYGYWLLSRRRSPS